jgi:hypothetical protein
MSSQSLTPRASVSVDEEKQDVNHGAHEPNNAVQGIEPSSEVSPDPEKGAEGEVKPIHAVEDDYEYITGIKLFLVMAGVTLACFLMLLDTSIITTVCPYSHVIERPLFAYHSTRPSLELLVISTPSQMWAGMAVHIFLQSRDTPFPKYLIMYNTLTNYSCAIQPLTGKIYSNFSSKVGLAQIPCSYHS